MFIHPITRLIYADPKTTAHFLSFVRCGIATMLQSANLKDIRVIPPFPQSRVRENKPYRIVQRQQLFFIFQNQFICGLIIADIRSVLQAGIRFMSLLVDAEITAENGW